MEMLQRELDELLQKINEKGFKIDDSFKLYKPDDIVYVIEEYWKKEGMYESQGKIKESLSAGILSEKVFELLYAKINNEGEKFVSDLYDNKTGIEELDDFNIGYYDISYSDNGSEFIEHMTIKHLPNNILRLDFGTDYMHGYGGYIEFKVMTLSEFNKFEEIEIDTF